MILYITSDAGANAYPGWGGYGASKAALEHASRVLAAELADSACASPSSIHGYLWHEFGDLHLIL